MMFFVIITFYKQIIYAYTTVFPNVGATIPLWAILKLSEAFKEFIFLSLILLLSITY